ncbi:NfeD family protein [Streptomyces sp. NBC_01803]|uniref:NfeD family protein n=1 Tax=Streptomyces sp. NBC_01803 TaxID=2975946 RepID=UPI002DDB9115|nr:NfeD family protein [Streptomyces sp. NBC_01803]WSA47308.1 NfeD family protein [Streptomyces sp. NBC_01803]
MGSIPDIWGLVAPLGPGRTPAVRLFAPPGAALATGAVDVLTGIALAGLVALALAAAVAGSLLAVRLARRAFLARPTTGREALLGREAVVRRTGNGAGQVLLEGAWWTVRGRDAPVREGQRVRVVGQEGLDLVVEDAGPRTDRRAAEEEPP